MNNSKPNVRELTDNLQPDKHGDYTEFDFHEMINAMKEKETKEFVFRDIPTTNNVTQIKDHLEREYSLALLTTEMKLHKARQTRMANDVQRYFNSTPLRNAFARWMVYGYMVNKPYNITTLVKEMVADRKTISIMIKECDEEGWIQTIKSNGQLFCLASPVLVDKMNDYINFRKEIAKDTIGQCFLALKNFEDLMRIDTTKSTQFSTEL